MYKLKLLFLPLHIVTTKTLKLRRDAAFQFGKGFSNKQIAFLIREQVRKETLTASPDYRTKQRYRRS